MEFKLPFLTLQQLSILKVCQHLADHGLGPFQLFRKDGFVNIASGDTLKIRFQKIADGLDLPNELKVVLLEVLDGTYHQVIRWVRKEMDCGLAHYRKQRDWEFLFDPYGRLDDRHVCRRCFEKTVEEADDWPTLYYLLRYSSQKCHLTEIDMAVRKVLTVAGYIGESGTQVEGPQYEILDGKPTLVYRFVGGHQQNSCDFILSSLTSIAFNSDCVIVYLPDHFTRSSLNVHWFKEHFRLLQQPVQKLDYVRGCVKRLSEDHDTGIMLDILNFLHHETPESWLIYFEGYGTTLACDVLDCLRKWPFNHFFIPVLQHVSNRLKVRDFAQLFLHIVEGIVFMKHFEVLNGKLLLDFWRELPLTVKRTFRNAYRSTNDGFDNCREFMRGLQYLEAEDTIAIHGAIVADLCAS